MRRILHSDIHYHPYKQEIVQELFERDFSSRKNAGEALLEDAIVFFTDEAHCHLSGQTEHALLG